MITIIMKNKRLAQAFISAIFVGGGQILKGDSDKGIKLLLTFYFGIPILLYVILAFSGGLFLIAFGISIIFAVILWVYNIIDAYSSPK